MQLQAESDPNSLELGRNSSYAFFTLCSGVTILVVLVRTFGTGPYPVPPGTNNRLFEKRGSQHEYVVVELCTDGVKENFDHIRS